MGKMGTILRDVYNWISGEGGSFLIEIIKAENQGIQALEGYVFLLKFVLNFGLITLVNIYYLRLLRDRSLYLLKIIPLEIIDKNHFILNKILN